MSSRTELGNPYSSSGVFKRPGSLFTLSRLSWLSFKDIRRRSYRQLFTAYLVSFIIAVLLTYVNHSHLRKLRSAGISLDEPGYLCFVRLNSEKQNVVNALPALIFVPLFRLYELRANSSQYRLQAKQYQLFFSRILANNQLITHYEQICKQVLTPSVILRISDLVGNFNTIVYTTPFGQNRYHNLKTRALERLGSAITTNYDADKDRRSKTIEQIMLDKMLCSSETGYVGQSQMLAKVKALKTLIGQRLDAALNDLRIGVDNETVKVDFTDFIFTSVMLSTYSAISKDITEWEDANLQDASVLRPVYYNFLGRRFVLSSCIAETVAQGLMSQSSILKTLVNYPGANAAQLLGLLCAKHLRNMEPVRALRKLPNATIYQWLRTFPGEFFKLLFLLGHESNVSSDSWEASAAHANWNKRIDKYHSQDHVYITYMLARVVLVAIGMYLLLSSTYEIFFRINIYRATRGLYLLTQVHYGELYAMLLVTQLMYLAGMIGPVLALYSAVLSPYINYPLFTQTVGNNVGLIYFPWLYNSVYRPLAMSLLRQVLHTTVTNTVLLWIFDEYAAYTAIFFMRHTDTLLTVLRTCFELYWAGSQIARVESGASILKLILDTAFFKVSKIRDSVSNLQTTAFSTLISGIGQAPRFATPTKWLMHNNGRVFIALRSFVYTEVLIALFFFLFVKPWVVWFAQPEYVPMAL